MSKFILSIFFISIFSSFSALSFRVDTLTKVISDKDSFITLTGDKGREYIYASLSKVVTDGTEKINELKLQPDDIASWPVIVEPGEFIIDEGDEVRFKISRNEGGVIKDTVVGLTLIPDNIDSRKNQSTGIKLSVGYKVWLFIAGSEIFKGDIAILKSDNKVSINNKSNKILRVAVDGCAKSAFVGCSGMIMSVPGSIKVLDAPVENTTLSFYTIDSKQTKVKEITL